MKSLFLICIISCIASSLAAERKKVVCYWGTWAVYRPGLGKFEVNNIDPNICTHVVYTFFGARADGQVTYLDPYLDLPDAYGKDYIGKFMKLKSINPDVKLIAAVGGWNQGSTVFSQIASSEATRNAFAYNAATFLVKHGFDGLDLDWEYPCQRGGVSADKENFIELLQTVRKALNPLQKSLSIAVGSTEKSASASYDIRRVADSVDFINLMSYDLHGSWNNFTGIHGALYMSSLDTTDELKQLNVDAAVNYWLSEGCPKEKLIVGIPTYGRTFTLGFANENAIGAFATGPGAIGSFVPEAGFLGYNELCYKHDEWIHHWEQQQKVPYAVKGNQWVGYDDMESVAIKLNYILTRDLGGAMFWSLETDDFSGKCGQGHFPLITLAHTAFNQAPETTTVTNTPSTKSTATTQKTSPMATSPTTQRTTANPVRGFQCPSTGLHRDPTDCRKFYNCAHGIAYHFDCPANLFFNENASACDWPRNVPCNSP